MFLYLNQWILSLILQNAKTVNTTFFVIVGFVLLDNAPFGDTLTLDP